MDLYAAASYHLTRDGQQYGPYPGDQLVPMAQSQQVLATDLLWSDGMTDWIPAQSFNQLYPVFAAMQPQVAQETTGPVVQTSVERGGTLRVARTGVSGPGIVKANIQTHTGNVSTRTTAPRRTATGKRAVGRPTAVRAYTGKKGANFAVLGWSLAAFFIGIALMVGGLIMVASSAPSMEEMMREEAKPPEINPTAGMLMLIGYTVYPIGMLVYFIVSLVYFHRAWGHLQILPGVRSTPGKAIGFLFIPFYNIYWMFVCYWGWSEDYNSLKMQAGLTRIPPMPSGLFMGTCILNLLGIPFLHPFMMYKVCEGVNALAATPDEEITGQAYA